ncbi:MAG: amidohydrolase family protein [Planctomycetota bacterium]|nr:amidohydrolase family protein [Planctomycetota bacterium]
MKLSRLVPLALALLSAPLAAQALGESFSSDEAERSAAKTGIAIRAAKILTSARKGEQVIDHGVVLVKQGKIEALGPEDEIEIPTGYEVVDVGDRWIIPGMIELHCHVAAGNLFTEGNEINDMIYLANPGLRVRTGVIPNHKLLRRGVAGGVTTVLYIPGSGTNMGGQGVLLKIGYDRYEEMELRQPGSLKLAQAGNPESWGPQQGRSFQNWHTRNMFQRGIAYAKRWEAFERGEGPEPEMDIQLEIFRDLHAKRAPVSTHTQWYQVVMMTILMVKVELGLNVFIDHGTFAGFKAAGLAEEHGVAAIIGPRSVARSFNFAPYETFDSDGKVLGICAEYQKRGHTAIGFNTDCIDNGAFGPAQEELSLQAAMAVRYGLENFDLEALRGLTIIPAAAVGLADRIGSLEPGKDADLVILDGDPADPRTMVELVYTDGRLVYDAEVERLW